MAELLLDPALCHAVLARCVEQPDRLQAGGTVVADPLALRQVTGFITKVRHNPIRFHFPLTMRALAAAGIEIDFFADHAPTFTALRRYGLDDEQRTTLFVAALRRWLEPSDDRHVLVADVLTHELTLRAVERAEPVPAPDTSAVVTAVTRPRLREQVRLLELSVHPPDVAGTSSVTSLDRHPRCYAYLPTVLGPRVRSLQPDLLPLLQAADGDRTITGIAARLGLAALVDHVVVVYRQLVHGGLADIEVPCG